MLQFWTPGVTGQGKEGRETLDQRQDPLLLRWLISGGFSSLGYKPRRHHQCCEEEGTAMRFRESAKADSPGEGFLDQVQTTTK